MEYLNGLNGSQREAVEQIDGPIMVIAGAGSGKTRVLTYRIAHMIKQGIDPFNILALTFTNKAAKEMTERINSIVGGGEARNITMGTFHSVFSRILRFNSDRLGYPQNFTIYDTSDSKSLLKDIIKELNLDDKTYKPSMVLGRISAAKNNLISPRHPHPPRRHHRRRQQLCRLTFFNKTVAVWTGKRTTEITITAITVLTVLDVGAGTGTGIVTHQWGKEPPAVAKPGPATTTTATTPTVTATTPAKTTVTPVIVTTTTTRRLWYASPWSVLSLKRISPRWEYHHRSEGAMTAIRRLIIRSIIWMTPFLSQVSQHKTPLE